MINATAVVTIVGLVQGLFILSLVLSQYKGRPSAHYAGYLLLIFIIDLSYYALSNLGFLEELWFLRGIGRTVVFLYGPIMYFYVKTVLGFETTRQSYLHFLPAGTIIVLFSPLFLGTVTAPIIASIKSELPLFLSLYNLKDILFGFVLWYGHVLIYFYLSLRLILQSERTNNTSEATNVQLNSTHLKWLKWLLMGYFGFAGISVIAYLLHPFITFPFNSYQILNVLLVFHIFCISYIGFTNQDRLLNSTPFVKYQKSTLSKAKQEEYLIVVLDYFKKEQPYLNQDLTLSKVATHLKIPSNHLSQVINDSLGKGFNEFVNGYRIELAKKYMELPENNRFTIAAIANEVGFRSKSSFNAAFKNKCGMTPSEFKNQSQKLV